MNDTGGLELTGADRGRDPTPGGGGGALWGRRGESLMQTLQPDHIEAPLQIPKLSHGTMCFVGAGDFVFGIR